MKKSILISLSILLTFRLWKSTRVDPSLYLFRYITLLLVILGVDGNLELLCGLGGISSSSALHTKLIGTKCF